MMESEDTRSQDLLGYDEQTETWFIDTKESGRLVLSRPSLERLVGLYNRIHKGRPLQLMEQREMRRIEESRKRHSETLRDLHLLQHRRSQRKPIGLAKRVWRRVISILRHR